MLLTAIGKETWGTLLMRFKQIAGSDKSSTVTKIRLKTYEWRVLSPSKDLCILIQAQRWPEIFSNVENGKGSLGFGGDSYLLPEFDEISSYRTHCGATGRDNYHCRFHLPLGHFENLITESITLITIK